MALITPQARRDPTTAYGLLLYVLPTRWTVVPRQRLARGGWLCEVVGGGGQLLAVRDDLIATAVEIDSVNTDPTTDRAVFLECWHAHLYPRWPGSTTHQFLAARIQTSLLPPDGLIFSLADGNVWRATAVACRVPTDILGRMLNNLVEGHLLELVGARTYRVTLPPPARIAPPVSVWASASA